MREISAGAVLYKKNKDETRFLLLYHGGDYWNFPKGKMNRKESEQDTALREIEEETGIARSCIRILPQFHRIQRYIYRFQGKTIYKIVVFFLAEILRGEVHISEEHDGFGWFLHKDARKMLKHKNSTLILDEARSFLMSQSRRVKPLSAFSRSVHRVVSHIPRGALMTYKEVAAKAERPNAARAVGNILHHNRDPRVPCHRVIRSDGEAGGYAWGKKRKKEALFREGFSSVRAKEIHTKI